LGFGKQLERKGTPVNGRSRKEKARQYRPGLMTAHGLFATVAIADLRLAQKLDIWTHELISSRPGGIPTLFSKTTV